MGKSCSDFFHPLRPSLRRQHRQRIEGLVGASHFEVHLRVGFGDDPELAARGMTGTGAPGLLNGVIVTASGLLFGAGRDNQIRAWDSDTGVQLWASRFGGDFVGSPVMYEMAGRQYLLVPAADTPPRGAGPGAAAPLGWVAYALPRN